MSRDLVHFMRRLFTPAAGDLWRPPADVYRTQDGWLVKFDLAGVRPQDVTITAQQRRVTLRGCRRDCCLGETCGQYHMEISYSQFERTIVLPEEIAPDSVTTEFRDGMLHVRLRKERQR
jgi:HSP20 family protein